MEEDFQALKARFASKEVTMEDIAHIDASGIVELDNRGISRSKKDCLLCVVRLRGEGIQQRFNVYLPIGS